MGEIQCGLHRGNREALRRQYTGILGSRRTGADGGTDQDLSRAPKFSGRQEALDRRTKFCLVDVPATIEPRLRLPSRDHRVVGASGVHSDYDQATGRRSTSSCGITSCKLLFKQPLIQKNLVTRSTVWRCCGKPSSARLPMGSRPANWTCSGRPSRSRTAWGWKPSIGTVS